MRSLPRRPRAAGCTDRQRGSRAERRDGRAAAAILGAELLRGEISDGHLLDVPEQRKTVIELYRRFRPTLVLAHSADDYHPDHRAASALAEAASWYCTSAGHASPSPVLTDQPILWWMDTINMTNFEPGFFVNVSEYIDLKRRMLACHKSQLQRGANPDFAPLVEQMAWQAATRGAQAGVPAAEAFRLHLAWKRARAW